MSRPPLSFYEFFAGGGMARLGLGDAWTCAFANDFDPVKAGAYAENFGEGHLRRGDVWALEARDLPGRADLAWASSPCHGDLVEPSRATYDHLTGVENLDGTRRLLGLRRSEIGRVLELVDMASAARRARW